jgi:uncharacterized protein (DUF983 family)
MNLRSILTLQCPVCGKGKLFKSLLDTPEQCPECKYYFMRESGYYLPHFPIAYLATAGAALGTWPLLKYVVGVQSDNTILTVMILVGLVFGLWSIRYAKIIWLNIDLTIHPPSREDFEQRGRNESKV